MRRRWADRLGLLVASVVVAGSAAAQPAAEPEAAQVEEARRHMEAGQDLYSQGRYGEAAQEFLVANETQPSSAYVFNVGLCYMQAGDGPNAVVYFRRYLDQEPGAADRAAIEERVREIEATVAAAPPPPPEGTPPTIIVTRETAAESRERMKSVINVQTVPEGARVLIDNAAGETVAEGMAPMTRALSSGDYVLRIEHPDFAAERTDIRVRAGGVYVYYYRLGQGQFLGFLRIIADQPGARVYVDSEEEGAAQVTPYQETLPVGEHRVWVKLAGYETTERTVDVEMGGTQDVTVELERVRWGELEVLTNVDAATITIDGEKTLIARADSEFGEGIFGTLVAVPAGAHRVLVAAEDMKDFEDEVEVSRGQRTRMLVRMNPSPSRVSAWVSFGVAAACLAAGGAFGGIALDIEDGIDRDREAGRLDNNDPRILDGLLWSVGADSAFVVGAVMTGLGFYYLFRDPLPESEARAEEPQDFSAIDGWAPPPDAPAEPAVEVTPTTGPTGLGLGLEVRF
jgi:hypothetical protein